MKLSMGWILIPLLWSCSGEDKDGGQSDTGLTETGQTETGDVRCGLNQYVEDQLCVDCPPGTTNPAGDLMEGENTACTPCESGWVSIPDQVECEPCAPGSYAEENDCLDCEEGFTSEEGSIDCELEGVSGFLDARDYGYLFWPGNHWVNWGSFFDVQHVQTGFYGLAMDVSMASFENLGLITESSTAMDGLSQGNDVITSLPTAAVHYALIKNGTEHRGAQSFSNREGSSTNPSEMIDMGRYMQRIEIPQVSYADSAGYQGSIQLAAMPRHFVLSHRVVSDASASDLTISVELEGDAVEAYTEWTYLEEERAVSIRNESGEGWSFIIPEPAGSSAKISSFGDGGLSFQLTFEAVTAGEEMALSVIGIPSNAMDDAALAHWINPSDAITVEVTQLNRDGSDAGSTEAVWDAQRGLYVVQIEDLTNVGAPTWPDWSNETYHNWYNRHRIRIENPNEEAMYVPLAFDGGSNAAFYITGGSPMLRSADLEPTGIPMQISKNWHETPYWYHLYSSMVLEPGVHEFEHTFAHAKWGETYAVQHAQLSLVGWGQNQQWDESSLGAWGESITYDPDMTLSRSTMDDVRPFLVDSNGKWSWTGNVGGASFLVYEPTEGYSSFASHQLGRMRTHYAYTGPNLTKVHYAGVSADGKIEASVATQLGRTDDLVRAYYHLSYTFLEDVNYDRIAFFQVAADRYSDNGFTRYAYGNESGVLFDESVPSHGTTGYAKSADRGIALEGDSPWVMLYDSSHTSGSLPEHVANVGFVIRDYSAEIGGVLTTTPHLNLVQTYNGGWSQMGFELGVPYDASNPVIPAGSVVTATVEYVVPPAQKDVYFGDSDYLTAMDAGAFQGTEMMQTLATENHLEVTASVGAVKRVHPVEIEAIADLTAAQFQLTGGLGYTPVSIHNLVRPDGWRLEQLVDGSWEPVSQEVEGKDYWQAYENAGEGSFELTFNVHNRGTVEYRLIR